MTKVFHCAILKTDTNNESKRGNEMERMIHVVGFALGGYGQRVTVAISSPTLSEFDALEQALT